MKRKVHFWLYEAPYFCSEEVSDWNEAKALFRAIQLHKEGTGVRAFFFDLLEEGSKTTSPTYYIGGATTLLEDLDKTKLSERDKLCLSAHADENNPIYNRILQNKYTEGMLQLLTENCVVFNEYLFVNGGK